MRVSLLVAVASSHELDDDDDDEELAPATGCGRASMALLASIDRLGAVLDRGTPALSFGGVRGAGQGSAEGRGGRGGDGRSSGMAVCLGECCAGSRYSSGAARGRRAGEQRSSLYPSPSRPRRADERLALALCGSDVLFFTVLSALDRDSKLPTNRHETET